MSGGGNPQWKLCTVFTVNNSTQYSVYRFTLHSSRTVVVGIFSGNWAQCSQLTIAPVYRFTLHSRTAVVGIFSGNWAQTSY